MAEKIGATRNLHWQVWLVGVLSVISIVFWLSPELQGLGIQALLSEQFDDSLYWLSLVLLIIALIFHRQELGKYQTAKTELVLAHNRYVTLQQEHDQIMKAMQAAHAELDLAREQALEYSERKSAFLADISHEVRTPLNAIMGYTDLLTVDSDQQPLVKQIYQASGHLMALIDDILDLSQLESGMHELSPDDCDLPRLLYNVCRLVKPQLAGRRLDLIPLFEASCQCHIRIDGRRLTQVLTNLLTNAIKYTPQGHISFRAHITDHYLSIEICDTGVGMTRAQIDTMTRPFVRHHAGLWETDSYGLGMAICHRLLKLMQADVDIESQLDEGTRISLKIPLTRMIQPICQIDYLEKDIFIMQSDSMYADSLVKIFSPSVHSVTRVSSTDKVLGAMPEDSFPSQMLLVDYESWQQLSSKQQRQLTHKMDVCLTVSARTATEPEESIPSLRWPILLDDLYTSQKLENTGKVADQSKLYSYFVVPTEAVLLVDDHPNNLRLLEHFMARLGVSYVSCQSGIEAINHCRQQSFSMIFMDIRMPVIDGTKTCQLLRQSGLKTTPIIALTANAMQGDREKLLMQGFDAYLSKPVSLSTINQLFVDFQGNAKTQDSSGIDWPELLSTCGQSEQLAIQMISQLIDSLAEILPHLDQQAEHELMQADLVHYWLAGISYSGARKLQQLMKRLETELRTADSKPAAALINEIEQEMRLVMAQAHILLAKYGTCTEESLIRVS